MRILVQKFMRDLAQADGKGSGIITVPCHSMGQSFYEADR